jgi:glycosyltransferase involved in cell wall biosynthesis
VILFCPKRGLCAVPARILESLLAMNSQPTASIIVATYNRAHVLRYSIASVVQSDFTDWELIIVGDGCTDDTQGTVRAFADPRIRFVNLPRNSGAQSEPNNAGLAMARGRYIFFLNHDDMYFSDHLTQSVAFMEREGADIAWSPVFLLHKSGLETGPPDPGHDIVLLDGAVADGRFDPRTFIIASSWVAEREACLSVGPWLAPRRTRLSPSQEWLFRAYRQKRRMAYHRHVSVLCIHAGTRRHSYLIRQSPDHERAWTWIASGNQTRDALLQCVALEQAGRLQIQNSQLQRFRARGLLRHTKAFAVDFLRRVGVHPVAAERLLNGEGKGDWIAGVRRFTGEAPTIELGETLFIGSQAAEPFLGRGWHEAEGTGRWSAASQAEILFSVAAEGAEDLVLELSGRPLRLPDRVTFALNGSPVSSQILDKPETLVRLPIRGIGSFWMTITVRAPTSPHAMANSPDMRTLGFWISWLRIVPNNREDAARSQPEPGD